MTPADAPVLPDKDGGKDAEFAIELTANGIQAWVEHMPMRVDYDPDADHIQDQLTLRRQLEFGALVDLAVTDERLFRDGQPCEDGEVDPVEHSEKQSTARTDGARQTVVPSRVEGSDRLNRRRGRGDPATRSRGR